MGSTFTAIFQNQGSDLGLACKKLTEIMLDTSNPQEIWKWTYNKKDTHSPECMSISGQLEFLNVHGFDIQLGAHFFIFDIIIGWYTLLEDERLQNRLRRDLSRFGKRFGPAIYLPSDCKVDPLYNMRMERSWEETVNELNQQLGSPKKTLKELLACIEGRRERCGYYVELF
ncbi:hypothetical protein ABEW34_11860 [Paenibacillus algorifonticola]|uniref:hypothetical protein n=1 Tax=Paenibacillus algorifonticola TaxID=684063 RepID=UPI003D290137